MRTKEFNQVKPYCYILKRISDGMKYHGVRWDNIRFNRTPNEDFGKYYFTSRASLKKEFKNNKSNFNFELTYTFDNKKEAQQYEVNFNRKILGKNDWLNQSAYPHLIQSEAGKQRIRESRLGSKLSPETIRKIKKAGSGIKKGPRTEAQKLIISKAVKKSYIGRSSWNKGIPMTNKTKNKLSKSLKGRLAWNKNKSVFRGKSNPFFGKKHTQETKDKMRAARIKILKTPSKKILEGRKRQAKKMRGRHYHTQESKNKISKVHLNNKYNVGRIVSKETRQKISKGNKGKIISILVKNKISESLKKYYFQKIIKN